MKTRRYEVKLIGETPLLMHRDDIGASERTRAWQKDPANKKASKAGDDRTPAWTWLGYCYHDDKRLVVDADNLMAMLRDGGKKCPATTGKGSLKAATQSGITVNEIGWPLLVDGKAIPWPMLEALYEEPDFEVHCAAAQRLGFELFAKRARVGQQKHIRVRPRFDKWTAQGSITVFDDQLPREVVVNVFKQAGFFCGLGDWRPGSPMSPGQYGRFSIEIEEAK